MKKDIYIFRHGQTDKNLAGIWQGSGSDDLLNATGLKQAQELAEKVRFKGMKMLYCSPMLRAVQTANAIAKRNASRLPVVILQDLREAYFGEAEGLSFDQVLKKYPDLLHKLFEPDADYWDLRFPGGESLREIYERSKRGLSLAVANFESTVGIMCHAGVIYALLQGLKLGDAPELENCSYVHLQYDTETHRFVLLLDPD